MSPFTTQLLSFLSYMTTFVFGCYIYIVMGSGSFVFSGLLFCFILWQTEQVLLSWTYTFWLETLCLLSMVYVYASIGIGELLQSISWFLKK